MSNLENAAFQHTIKDRAFDLLKPLFEIWGEDRVIESIHQWYHNKHRAQ